MQETQDIINNLQDELTQFRKNTSNVRKLLNDDMSKTISTVVDTFSKNYKINTAFSDNLVRTIALSYSDICYALRKLGRKLLNYFSSS